MRLFGLRSRKRPRSHSIVDYQKLVSAKLRQLPTDRALALANAIGAVSLAEFDSQGDGHVAVLRHHGLIDDMSVYDLGCGCGRTAQALQRSGWVGRYIGADVVPELIDEIKLRCPAYETKLNFTPTIVADDNTLDIVFHWSVFTHLYPGECFLYTADAFRSLKPGGKMVFSFLELEDVAHDRVWNANLDRLHGGHIAEQLDTFLHRDWIRRFAKDIGFAEPSFTDGWDGSMHPPFWQSVAVMHKPA